MQLFQTESYNTPNTNVLICVKQLHHSQLVFPFSVRFDKELSKECILSGSKQDKQGYILILSMSH